MERDGKLQVNPLFGGGVQERWGTQRLELKTELVQGCIDLFFPGFYKFSVLFNTLDTCMHSTIK
jgi:hypothetical protein